MFYAANLVPSVTEQSRRKHPSSVAWGHCRFTVFKPSGSSMFPSLVRPATCQALFKPSLLSSDTTVHASLKTWPCLFLHQERNGAPSALNPHIHRPDCVPRASASCLQRSVLLLWGWLFFPSGSPPARLPEDLVPPVTFLFSCPCPASLKCAPTTHFLENKALATDHRHPPAAAMSLFSFSHPSVLQELPTLTASVHR